MSFDNSPDTDVESQIFTYDPVTGFLIETEFTYRNGTVEVIEGGYRYDHPEVRIIETAYEGDEAWDTQIDHQYFDASFGWRSLRIDFLNDDASSTTEFIGFRSYPSREVDAANLYDWAFQETFYGSGGNQITETFYDDGLRTVVVETDATFGEVIADEYDLGDQYLWSRRGSLTYENYSPDGPVFFELAHITWDDGVTRLQNQYVDGPLISASFQDAADAHDWALRTLSYDQAGAISFSVRVMDDGRRIYNAYDNDGALTWSRVSLPNEGRAEGGASTRSFRDGDTVFRITDHEDGSQSMTVFEDGVRVRRVVTEGDDISGYSAVTTEFNSAGSIIDRTIVQEDGLHTHDDFWGDGFGGQRVRYEIDLGETSEISWRVTYDPNSSYAISLTLFDSGVLTSDDGRPSEWDMYDAFGWLAVEIWDEGPGGLRYVTSYDSSDFGQRAYRNGELSFLIEDDDLNEYGWDRRSISTTSDGSSSFWRVMMDNGVMYEAGYDYDVLVSRKTTDVADLFAFTERVETFDETGAVTSRTTTMDNGLIREDTFVDGVLATRVLTDGGEAYDWAERSFTFDAEGNVLTSQTVPDPIADGLVGAGNDAIF